MRALFIGILFIFSGLNVLAQSKSDTCDFLKNLKFKNERDTIILKATLHSTTEAPPRIITKKHPTIYKYKFNSEIAFKPQNCSKTFNLPLLNSAYDERIVGAKGIGKVIFLTCVVFNEHFYYTNGNPDCIVIKVSQEKPIKFQ